MSRGTLEERMTRLEQAVYGLQQAICVRKPPTDDWLDHVIGTKKDEPAFDEVLAYGRAIRQADRPAEESSK
jgi:hypothetical protein